jgi:hypothetical protein
MKKSLLASVAAVALIATPAFAQRQEAPPSKSEAPAKAPAAVQNAPAEKVAPAAPSPDKAPMNRSTTGQAAPSAKPDADIKAKPDADIKTRSDTRPADTRSGDTKTPAAQTQTKTQTTTGSRTSPNAVELTTEQKAKVRSTVLTGNAPRVTNVNFTINVGTVVPRSVRIVAVPATLVEIHPAWRGYMYFVHGDEIVIVEPGTLRIVAVLTV